VDCGCEILSKTIMKVAFRILGPLEVLIDGRVVELSSGRDRFDDADRLEPGTLRGKRNLAARGSVEDEKADLVLGNMDRAFAADTCPVLRQLLGGRAGPTLEGGAFSSLTTSEIRFDKVARHALDTRPRPPR
jgi:hypothetical protein